MKRVKDYLLEVDEESLVEFFFEKYAILSSYEYYEDDLQEMRIKEFREERIMYVRKLIDRLKKLEIKESKDPGIFFVYRLENHQDDLYFDMTTVSELRKKGVKAECFGFDIERQEEILSWYIPDTILNRRFIKELLAYILNEASFFGIEQEGLGELYERLDEAKEESDRLIEEYGNKEDDRIDYAHYVEAYDDLLIEAIDRLEALVKERELSKVIAILKRERIY